jgi:hypothetical protein
MSATFLNELVTAVVQMLPRLFVVGAPVLALVIAMAALADARMPGGADRARTR